MKKEASMKMIHVRSYNNRLFFMLAWKSYVEIRSKFGVGNDTAGPGATGVRYHRPVLGRSAELR